MPPSGQDHVLHALVHMPDQKGSDGRWLIQKLESPQGLNTKRPAVQDNAPHTLLEEAMSFPLQCTRPTFNAQEMREKASTKPRTTGIMSHCNGT
jgi:hypothetical protein